MYSDTVCEKSDSKVHPSLPAVIVNESHSAPTSYIAGGKSGGRNSKVCALQSRFRITNL